MPAVPTRRPIPRARVTVAFVMFFMSSFTFEEKIFLAVFKRETKYEAFTYTPKEKIVISTRFLDLYLLKKSNASTSGGTEVRRIAFLMHLRECSSIVT